MMFINELTLYVLHALCVSGTLRRRLWLKIDGQWALSARLAARCYWFLVSQSRVAAPPQTYTAS